MKAKFEKWFEEDCKHMMCGIREAEEIWGTAIQSLEVTPELVDAAKEGLFGSSYYDLGYQGYIGDAAIHEALTSVFNAIKE